MQDDIRDRLAKLISDALRYRDNPSPMTILQFIWPEIEKIITDVVVNTINLEPMDERGQRVADRDWEAINEATAQALRYKSRHDRLLVLINDRILDLYSLAEAGSEMCFHSGFNNTCPGCWSREVRRWGTYTMQRIDKLNP